MRKTNYSIPLVLLILAFPVLSSANMCDTNSGAYKDVIQKLSKNLEKPLNPLSSKTYDQLRNCIRLAPVQELLKKNLTRLETDFKTRSTKAAKKDEYLTLDLSGQLLIASYASPELKDLATKSFAKIMLEIPPLNESSPLPTGEAVIEEWNRRLTGSFWLNEVPVAEVMPAMKNILIDALRINATKMNSSSLTPESQFDTWVINELTSGRGGNSRFYLSDIGTRYGKDFQSKLSRRSDVNTMFFSSCSFMRWDWDIEHLQKTISDDFKSNVRAVMASLNSNFHNSDGDLSSTAHERIMRLILESFDREGDARTTLKKYAEKIRKKTLSQKNKNIESSSQNREMLDFSDNLEADPEFYIEAVRKYIMGLKAHLPDLQQYALLKKKAQWSKEDATTARRLSNSCKNLGLDPFDVPSASQGPKSASGIN